MTLKHVHEARTAITLCNAWRLKDPSITRDAEAFWQREHLLPSNTDAAERLDELCMAGYDGARLIALTTARVRHISFLGVKLAMLRVAVDHEMRRNRLATIIQAESRELLEQWSLANPAEEVMGMGTVTQTNAFDERGWSRGYLRSSHLGFVGWTANGEAMRVAWFEHARIPIRRPTSENST